MEYIEPLEVKVTRLKNGYGIRIIDITKDKIICQTSNIPKIHISGAIKSMLRMVDKMDDPMSRMASDSRHRDTPYYNCKIQWFK